MMHEYIVEYRPEATELSRSSVRAHRVEGWNKDYAFFGDEKNLNNPTELVPREVVLRVSRN